MKPMREKAGMRECTKEARSVEGKRLTKERERKRGRELKREVEEKTERSQRFGVQ